MSEFYYKKQNELNEELKYLHKRKRDIKTEAFDIYNKIDDLLAELSLLKNQESLVINRLLFLGKSELRVYGLEISQEQLLSGGIFINKTKEYIKDIKNTSGHILNKDDENE